MPGDKSQGRGDRSRRVVRAPATKFAHLQKRMRNLRTVRDRLRRKSQTGKS
ncbi:MAG: hypothetical protein NZ899_11440 [Thermoguttaceae bacterium]|nr:hypothetical protein [Thermoguttaceae bacterium]MDW8079544.1 hypothetical protein [Thermoguttaceae bacterium]